MTSDTRSHSLYVLFRLSFDSIVNADGNMSSALETAFAALEGSMSEAEFENDVRTLVGSSVTPADCLLASDHTPFHLWPNR